ncbi:MAG: ribonuclease H-like domain-containing protein [Saprospirales bacterium]|nr:ribonuclease H-like domain-containing protein [Saprospirales bacterium]
MLNVIDIANVLFLDIECVSGEPNFEELPEHMQELWKIKARGLNRAQEELEEEAYAETYLDKAAIYAEFGKIICISVGFVTRDKEDQRLRLRLKSFESENEREVLEGFSQLLNQFFNNPDRHFLCGHNIKEFDIPYICRRMVINQLPFPAMMDITGKKPWETKHLLDTMELWKFGDRKSFTSLKLLAAVLDFPSPKEDIDGSQVGRVFWEENDLERIALYCEKDVLATVQLFLRLRRMPILEDNQIIHVPREK